MGGEQELRAGERVHMVEGRGDQEAVAVVLRVRAEAHVDHPEMAGMGERHALGHAGGAGGVEDLRHIAGFGHDGLEVPRIEERLEIGTEFHRRQAIGRPLPAGIVHEQQLRAAVAQHMLHGLVREAPIDRHRDEARAHGAEIDGEPVGAVGGEDGDALAALEPPPQQRAGDGAGALVEPAVRALGRTFPVGRVDDRGQVRVLVPVHEVAEIVAHGCLPPCCRRGRIAAGGKPVPACAVGGKRAESGCCGWKTECDKNLQKWAAAQYREPFQSDSKSDASRHPCGSLRNIVGRRYRDTSPCYARLSDDIDLHVTFRKRIRTLRQRERRKPMGKARKTLCRNARRRLGKFRA